MPRKETPQEFSARRICVAIERAKIAVMGAQQILAEDGFRLTPTEYQHLTDAALRRLDKAWVLAYQKCRKD